jgi:hypothetical protein
MIILFVLFAICRFLEGAVNHDQTLVCPYFPSFRYSPARVAGCHRHGRSVDFSELNVIQGLLCCQYYPQSGHVVAFRGVDCRSRQILRRASLVASRIYELEA